MKWDGLAISQQTADGKPHRDQSDMKEGFNCVIGGGCRDLRLPV